MIAEGGGYGAAGPPPAGWPVQRQDLCVCLDSVFPGGASHALPWLAKEGIRRIEFWDWRDHDLEAVRRAVQDLRLEVVAFSGNTFDEPLVDPDASAPALAHLSRSLKVARRLDVRHLVVHVGYTLSYRNTKEQWDAAVAGLRAAGALAAAAGVTLAVEPLNSVRDHPGYFLDRLDDAHRLLQEVGHASVRLLLDVYHMWQMHEDLLDHLSAVASSVVHVHAADVPGRGEPGSGTIPWRDVLRELRAGGYHGPIGLECWPTGSVEEALRRSAEVLAE